MGDPADADPSVFTSALVEGLRTGDADRDLDGWVSLDELYTYVHEEVTRVSPDQKPTKWAFDIAGDIRVAKRGRPVTQPADLPQPLIDSMTSLFAWERSSVIAPLAEWLAGPHPGRALAARLALEALASNDDSDRVKEGARLALRSDTTPGSGDRPDGHDSLHGRTTPAEPEQHDPTGTEEWPDSERRTFAASQTPSRDEPPSDSGSRSMASSVPRHVRAAWASRWLQLATVVALVALLSAVWMLVPKSSSNGSGHGADPEDAKTSRTLGIPETSMVLSRMSGEVRQLVALDTRSGRTEALDAAPKANRPAISPDRWEVAYLLSEGTGPGIVEVLDGDGDTRTLLSKASAKKCPLTYRPGWSPDSKHLALICFDREGKSLGIWVTNRAGNKIRPIIALKAGGGAPSWGGDGKIYFSVVDPAGTTPDRIYAVSESGKGRAERATEGNDFESSPDWGRSGLFYLSSRARDLPGDLYVRDHGTRRLTKRNSISSFTRSPDEKSVAWLAPFSRESVDGVWVASFDAGAQKPIGPPEQLAFSGRPGLPTWGSR